MSRLWAQVTSPRGPQLAIGPAVQEMRGVSVRVGVQNIAPVDGDTQDLVVEKA